MILDSNVLIYAIRPEYRNLRIYLEENRLLLHASAISLLEALGYHRLTTSEEAEFRQLFDTVVVIPIGSIVIAEAIHLRQQRKRSLGDSIIAATALLYNLPVLTNNITDFAGISGLQVIALADVLSA